MHRRSEHRRSEHRHSEHRHSEHRQHGGFLCFWHSEASAGTPVVSSLWRWGVKWETRVIFHIIDQKLPTSIKTEGRHVMTLYYCQWRITGNTIILKVAKSCYTFSIRLKRPKKTHYIKIICKLTVSFFCLWVIRRCWNVTLAELDIQMWDQSAAQTYRCEIDIHFSMNRNVF